MRPMSSLVELIACPVCHGSLSLDGVLLVCEDCNLDYPVQDGVPVLLDEESRSVLGPALDKYEERYRSPDQTGIVRRVYEGIYPSVDMRFLGRVRGIRHHYAALGAFLQSFPAEARILDLGSGAGRRLDDRSYNLDIDVYPEVDIVGDALKLPLKDSCWDGVVVQMVAEHVPDPFRLASEINRILVPNGRVFCDAPFQFHQHGEADYFRYNGRRSEGYLSGVHRGRIGRVRWPGVKSSTAYGRVLFSGSILRDPSARSRALTPDCLGDPTDRMDRSTERRRSCCILDCHCRLFCGEEAR